MGALAGGDAAGNAEAVHKVFAGADGPIRDIVALNAAAALVVADVVPDLGGRGRARPRSCSTTGAPPPPSRRSCA